MAPLACEWRTRASPWCVHLAVCLNAFVLGCTCWAGYVVSVVGFCRRLRSCVRSVWQAVSKDTLERVAVKIVDKAKFAQLGA
jgi:hypothetical protein